MLEKERKGVGVAARKVCEGVRGGVRQEDGGEVDEGGASQHGQAANGPLAESLELGGYRKRIGLEGSGDCRRCGEEVEETVEQVVQCVAGAGMRMKLGLSDDVDCLSCRPREALAYWKWWRRVRLKP